MIKATPAGSIKLYHAASNTTNESDTDEAARIKLETSSTGITVSGSLTADSSSSNAAIIAKGDGSSQDGYIQLNCSQNSHGVKIASPPHSANASYTLTLPNDDGDANQVLKSDGSGGLDWVDQPTANATHTGEVTGATALTIADNVVDEANLKVSNSPTDGYVLTAQSGNTGGLTWAAASGGSGGLSSDSDKNTIGGTNAGDAITAGSGLNNTLIGYDAGTSITTADHSTALGLSLIHI